MPATMLETLPQVRKATHVQDLGGGMVAAMHVTEDHHAVCPFLGLDDKCTVYDQRPMVCRKFGDESHPMMTCSYQSKDGRIRERPERRQIERMHAEKTYKALR